MVDPCTVTRVTLDTPLCEGVPAIPVIEYEGAPDANESDLVVTWRLSHGSQDVLHVGRVYVPTEQQVGHRLSVHVCHPAFPEYGLTCTESLTEVKPKSTLGSSLRDNRLEGFRKKAGYFRVVSFNILAPCYARTKVARDVYYSHLKLSPQVLEWAHRGGLVMRELMDVGADILCLQVDVLRYFKKLLIQEVDSEASVWSNGLKPLLVYLGYSTDLCMKRPTAQVPVGTPQGSPHQTSTQPPKTEGLLTAVKLDKLETDFSLTSTHLFFQF